jgi:hypothetical protein
MLEISRVQKAPQYIPTHRPNIFSFLLIKRTGRERYWLAFAFKLLDEDSGNGARTCVSL